MSYKLSEIFIDMQENANYYVTSSNGTEFESRFRQTLKTEQYDNITQKSNTKSAIKQITILEKNSVKNITQKWENLKANILLKNSFDVVKNPFQNIKKTYIFQPFGSQQFPDFVIFTNKKVIPIEIKFSKNEKGNVKMDSSRPMWNSNIPKPNAIYIYGIANEKVTFFKGSDILDFETRSLLLEFFDTLLPVEKSKEFNKKLSKLNNNFGIYPYIRKAYEHKGKWSTYRDEKGQQVVESYFSKNSKERENNVIEFLKELSNDE